MAEREIFSKAPITEALLDIRVTLAQNTSLEQLATLHEIVKDDYPNKRERKIWQSAIHVKDEGPEVAKPSGGTDGYLFPPLTEKTSYNLALTVLPSTG